MLKQMGRGVERQEKKRNHSGKKEVPVTLADSLVSAVGKSFFACLYFKQYSLLNKKIKPVYFFDVSSTVLPCLGPFQSLFVSYLDETRV